MKIRHSLSFARQLTIYLLLVLIVAFSFISLTLTNTLHQFIENNAYTQATAVSDNVLLLLEREITRIENIPGCVFNLYSPWNKNTDATGLPAQVLKSYPSLIGCSLHYPQDSQTGRQSHPCAYRAPNGTILFSHTDLPCPLVSPPPAFLRRTPQGFWINSSVQGTPTLAYCYSFTTPDIQPNGILKIDFPLETIRNILCNYKLFKSGYLFLLDSLGRYMVHPDSQVTQQQFFRTRIAPENPGCDTLYKQLCHMKAGSCKLMLHQQKHYLYLSTVPTLNWRLGITCPYNEILSSSDKLSFIIFLCLGLGLLFLFMGVINIVQRLSIPLRQLAYTTRYMAEGHFDTPLPHLKTSYEIQEVYDSVRYLQQNLIHYIERLKITTAEKEQLNSEIRLAQKIQQQFLPKQPFSLPSSVELYAELRPSREVGGDLYEFFLLGDKLYFAIGDVSGCGVPAALYMASIVKFFRYIAEDHHSTAEICNIINRNMHENAENDMYLTLFMGILDIHNGIITYTNAGHPYPFILQENGTLDTLDQFSDIPIGILEDHTYTEHFYTLRPQAVLLAYTDGITDAENENAEFYGKVRLQADLQTLGPLPPEELIQTVFIHLRQYMGQQKPSDDQTLLSVLYKGSPGSLNNHLPSGL